jgi:hypothetical protein
MPQYDPRETAASHLRNALAALRLTMQTAPTVAGEDGPALVVTAEALGAVVARIEAALERLPSPNAGGRRHECS